MDNRAAVVLSSILLCLVALIFSQHRGFEGYWPVVAGLFGLHLGANLVWTFSTNNWGFQPIKLLVALLIATWIVAGYRYGLGCLGEIVGSVIGMRLLHFFSSHTICFVLFVGLTHLFVSNQLQVPTPKPKFEMRLACLLVVSFVFLASATVMNKRLETKLVHKAKTSGTLIVSLIKH